MLAVMMMPLVVSCGGDSEKEESHDYDSGTKFYFAYQNPIKTLILGNDYINDNSLEKEHKCQIWAAMGGPMVGQYGGQGTTVDIVVDETLCDNLWFADENADATTPVLPMPTSYYRLLDNKITYNGENMGSVDVQFTDAYFNDPKSVKENYVIPILMTKVNGKGSILVGKPREGQNPSRTDLAWDIFPMDYVLFCVKYKNPWDGLYYRRGVDIVSDGSKTTTIIRKDISDSNNSEYTGINLNPNHDEQLHIYTKNMTQAIFPATFKINNVSITCNLILTFNGDKCTISTNDENVKASGSGEFIVKGTEKADYKDYQLFWVNIENEGGQMKKNVITYQRDILRLAYNIEFQDRNIHVSTNDTLVGSTRESGRREFFSYIKK